MTNIEKAKWLQTAYKNYPLGWYLEDTKRLQAIYLEQVALQNKAIDNSLQREMEEKRQAMASKYFETYGSDYFEDFKKDRRATHERVLQMN